MKSLLLLPLENGGITIDLFKVKAANKGKPEYEGPLYAYRALVKSKRREGVYRMPCAAPDLASA